MEDDFGMMGGVKDAQASGPQEDRTVSEQRIAQLMGVGREVLRGQRRHLPPGSWCRRGNAVAWRLPAVLRLLDELELDHVRDRLMAEFADEASGPDGEDDADAPRWVTVMRLPRNPKLLLCESPSGEEVRVRVRTTKNFIAGMEIPVRVNGGGLAELACALPRLRGRLPARALADL